MGAGTGPRRCVAGIVAKEERPNFAATTVKYGNLGVGVRGGNAFVVHTLTLQCQKYVFRTPEEIAAGNLPTRCLVVFDIVNMFNRISRRACRRQLQRHFPHLLPLFDALYRKANKVYIRREDRTLETLLQVEGFA